VCLFWYQSARDIAEGCVNRVDLDPARIQPGLETAETSGVLSLKRSPLLGGPMRRTEMRLIGLLLAGVLASTKPIVAHAVPLGSDIELSHWPVVGFLLI
jgi:hypothetical protein